MTISLTPPFVSLLILYTLSLEVDIDFPFSYKYLSTLAAHIVNLTSPKGTNSQLRPLLEKSRPKIPTGNVQEKYLSKSPLDSYLVLRTNDANHLSSICIHGVFHLALSVDLDASWTPATRPLTIQLDDDDEYYYRSVVL
jgi:hypothetical protein